MHHHIADAAYLREHRTYNEVAYVSQGNAAVRLTFQREAIDREERLVHGFAGQDRTVGQKPFYFVDAAFELRFQCVDVHAPAKINVHHTTPTAGVALHDGHALYFLYCTFQWFGHGYHHAVYGLLSGIGYYRDAWEQNFGEKIGLHLCVAPCSGKQQ